MATIYPVGPDDWRSWRSVRLRALLEAPDAFGSTDSKASGANDHEAHWRGCVSSPGRNLLAETEGTNVGLARVSRREPGAYHLTSSWVAPEARGVGIGGLLVESCGDWLQTSDPGGLLQLSVRRRNVPARRLHERLGFTRVGTDPDDATEDVMIKRDDR